VRNGVHPAILILICECKKGILDNGGGINARAFKYIKINPISPPNIDFYILPNKIGVNIKHNYLKIFMRGFINFIIRVIKSFLELLCSIDYLHLEPMHSFDEMLDFYPDVPVHINILPLLVPQPFCQ
jgi:hypothetical protein